MKIPYPNRIIWQWKTRHDPDCLRALMIHYWKTLLVICITIAAASILFAVWTIFAPFSTFRTDAPVRPDTTEALSREQMRSALDLFEQRTLQYERIKTTPPNIIDPS